MKRRSRHSGSHPRKTGLSEEDHALWHQVKKTVEPLRQRDPGRMSDLIEKAAQEFQADVSIHRNASDAMNRNRARQKQAPMRNYPVAPYSPPVSTSSGTGGAIDDRTARKLLKGKISVDGRIDLHGMTQDQAHRALLRFLAISHGAGDRMVLVITGKGRMSEGILRQMVPVWLREPALSIYVSAFRSAHITHGGEGALYVRLRRSTREKMR